MKNTAALILLAFLAACGGPDEIVSPPPMADANAIYRDHRTAPWRLA